MIRLKEREVVIVGGGLTAGLVARRLVPAGRDVLVLERGPDRAGGPEEELPSQRDDLRWNSRRGLTQRENVETITLRHKPGEEALPMRRLTGFLPGFGVGGAISHWNGQTWRFQTTDYGLRSHLLQRYGALPEGMTVQDWGLKYDDLEKYYTLFEQIFAISGEAGNIKGVKRPQGNPFEPYRSAPYALPPLEPTEVGLMFRKAAASLGYHPFPMPAANASRAHTNPDGMKLGACQYCGHCERFICEAKAKSSARRHGGARRLRLQQHAAAPHLRHRQALRPEDRRGRGRQELLLPDHLGGAGVLRGPVLQSLHGRGRARHHHR